MADQIFDLTGRVTLITGGNSGIGLGMAEGLARCGSEVAIWGTNPQKNAAAVEYARYNVTANAVLPGWIETAMTENATSNTKLAEAVNRRIPARRWGQAEDFAGIAIYLMSGASSYHTADSFLIDGGYAAF